MALSSVTKLGPLPTFTPPDACYTPYMKVMQDDSWTHMSVMYGASCSPYKSVDPRCYPSNMKSMIGTVGVYSPGFGCPTGWTTACSASRADGGSIPWAKASTMGLDAQAIWSKLVPGEQWIGCCPSKLDLPLGCDLYDIGPGCTMDVVSISTMTLTGLHFDYTCKATPTSFVIGPTTSGQSLFVDAAMRINYIIPGPNSKKADEDAANAKKRQYIAIGVGSGLAALLIVGAFFYLQRKMKRLTAEYNAGTSIPLVAAEHAENTKIDEDCPPYSENDPNGAYPSSSHIGPAGYTEYPDAGKR